MEDQEIWKDVIDYEGHYKVSSHGRVMSLKKNNNGKIKAQTLVARGYPAVCIRKDGKTRMRTVHRIQALAFMPHKDSDKLNVNHIDGDKMNNHISNLEWVTSAENTAHAYATGLRKGKKGGENQLAKLDEFKTLTVHTLIGNWSNKKIAAHYGVVPENISCIKHGKSWDWMGVHQMHTLS